MLTETTTEHVSNTAVIKANVTVIYVFVRLDDRYEIRRRVLWYLGTSVSEKRGASIFEVKDCLP